MTILNARPELESASTDASATPTTTLLEIPLWANGYRVWWEEPPVTEEFFTMYRRHNGGEAVQCVCERFQSFAAAAEPGDLIALGTTDGRPIKITPIIAPTSLTAPSAVSGTALADRYCPPLFPSQSTTSAHVTLIDFNQTIKLEVTDATDRICFISEYDGNTWTPARWVRLVSGTPTHYLCTFKQIAIANDAGVTVTVTAPTGAVIGGTSKTMTLSTYPAFTGTSRTFTDYATFLIAAALCLSGDELVPASAGTTTVTYTASMTEAIFTANGGSGHGIGIRAGAGQTLVFAPSGNVVFTLNQHAQSAYFGMKDVSFLGTGSTSTGSIFGMLGGHFALERVTCTTTGSQNGSTFSFAVDGATNPIVADVLECTATGAVKDCFSTSGHASTNAASLIRLINCTATTSGVNANDQCFTCHIGLAMTAYGGLYSDANSSVMANDASTSPAYAFFCRLSQGSRQASIQHMFAMYGCDIAGGATSTYSQIAAGSYLRCNKIVTTALGASTTLIRSLTGTVALGSRSQNYFESLSAVGRCCYPTCGGSADFTFNIVRSFTNGFLNTSSSGNTTPNVCVGNTFINANLAINDATVGVTFHHNALVNAAGFAVVGGGATPTGSYNTYKNQSGYTAGTGDTAGSNAAIDGTSSVPTASGNVDRNGDGTLIPYDGGSDYCGHKRITKAGFPSKGAREKALIVAGATLYNDTWI